MSAHTIWNELLPRSHLKDTDTSLGQFKAVLKPGFLPARRYASAGNSDRNVSVCPSVCPSRAGIVSKRRKLAA